MFRHLTAACFMTVLTAVHAQEPLTQAPGVPAVPLQATITVDPGKTLGKVNRLLFGNNQLGYQMESWNESRLNWVNCGYGIWDPERARPEPALLQLAKDVGMSVCRWPGGCGSHNFNWKRTVGPLPERANQKFGLSEFMAYCEALGAIPIITVAEYWGEAQDGADLVEYLNAPDDGKHPWAARRAQDGHPKPYGAVWFEYGNESYHGNHGGKTCLMIVNKHMTSVFATRIAGVAAQHVEAFCLTGPSVDAVNESVPNNVCVRPLPATVESGKVVVNLPPFSLTAVVLAP